MKPGDAIQYKKVFESGVRLGGAEPKVLTYVSDSWVGFRVTSSRGMDLGEVMMKRAEFEEALELVNTVKHFKVGQTWVNTVHRELDILAVDDVEGVEVIAYRYKDGHGGTHLRSAAKAGGWTLA